MNKNEFLLITPELLKLAKKTGQYQMEYHKKTVKFKVKDDKTPVTEIDINSSNMIKNILQKIIPGVPVISEEDQPTTNNADYFWIIDPLDGTKNYLKGNDHFCINIALISNKEPILGLIYSPKFNLAFTGFKDYKATKHIHKEGNFSNIEIKTGKVSPEEKVIVYTSSSIPTDTYKKLENQFNNIEINTISSALKFGYIACGQGSFYPRLGPTYEWDTAAGQCIIEAAGGLVVDKFMKRLSYNKNPGYLNGEFFVIGDPLYDWSKIVSLITS